MNILPCKVEKIIDAGGPFVNVQVDTGNLWARVTRKSIKDLDIYEGREVFIMIKTMGVSLGASVESIK
ncbi:TOBE domain-containing protein [Thermodesulfobacteriota bacterium]